MSLYIDLPINNSTYSNNTRVLCIDYPLCVAAFGLRIINTILLFPFMYQGHIRTLEKTSPENSKALVANM